jgi:protein TonB
MTPSLPVPAVAPPLPLLPPVERTAGVAPLWPLWRVRPALLGALMVALMFALAAGLAPTPAAAQTAPQARPPAQAPAQPRPAARPPAPAAAAPLDMSVFAMVPAPMVSGEIKPSAAEAELDYRADAARHLYAAYPTRVFRGKLPPLLFSVMMVETEIDAQGQVVDVSIIRRPAVDAVAPWVVAMIKRAAPYPVPPKLVDNASGTVRYMDVWLVDKSGLFQVDTLTEGQR